MTDNPTKHSNDWQASWESNEAAQLDSWLSATPAQRLAWLEEALQLAYRTGALAKREQGALKNN